MLYIVLYPALKSFILFKLMNKFASCLKPSFLIDKGKNSQLAFKHYMFLRQYFNQNHTKLGPTPTLSPVLYMSTYAQPDLPVLNLFTKTN